MTTSKQRDRVLIVDDDPEVRELLMDQIFNPNKFEVFEARDGAEGLDKVSEHQPDLIYIDLVMPGLTGKDMLVGIKSRQFEGPIIVGVKRGKEPTAIEAFRFGATDYITKPIREPEMMSVVSRALGDIQLRKERDNLMTQLQTSNAKLESQLNHLTTLQNLGRNLTAMHNIDEMFEAVLAGAVSVTESDHATLILLDEQSGKLVLRAGKNMTLVMQEKLGEPISDELAKLVMTSEEPAVVAGDGLKRFKIARDISAAIYAPMIVHGKAIGVMTVGNHRKRKVFDEEMGSVVNALADYAAIAIVNARLFSALDKRAQLAYAKMQEHDQKIAETLLKPVAYLHHQLQQLTNVDGVPDGFKSQLLQCSMHTEQIEQFVQQLRAAPTSQ